jgi:hypothetical protein
MLKTGISLAYVVQAYQERYFLGAKTEFSGEARERK